MFIIFLNFSDNKTRASEYMDGHNAWIKQGFDDGVFLVAGSLASGEGGGIVAHNTTRDDLEHRINDDPFVAENVVNPQITEINPARVDERLQFLSS